MALEYSFMKIG